MAGSINRVIKLKKRLDEAAQSKPATTKIDGEKATYSGYGVGGRFTTEEGASMTQQELFKDTYSKGVKK